MKRERVAAVWSDAEEGHGQAATQVLARGTPKWASKRDDELAGDSDSEFESFLASTSVANALKRFRHDGLRMRRRGDLNIDARSVSGAIQSVSWQRLGKDSINRDPLVAFASRNDKELRLCRVSENGKESNIEYSLKLQALLPPRVVQFISEDELLVTSSMHHGKVLMYNVATEKHQVFAGFGGRRISHPTHIVNTTSLHNGFSIAYEDGRIITVDRRSKQLVSELRLNNSCVGLSWSPEGQLYCGDSRANVYLFDARSSGKCLSRSQLSTVTSLSSFTMNASGLIACGSPFGTVDIVDAFSLNNASTELSVINSFDRIVTEINGMVFHPTVNSLLFAYSSEKKNAVRFFECQSGKTLAGWPSEQEPIGRAWNAGFSDCGRFLAVGCKSGRVQMYALEQ